MKRFPLLDLWVWRMAWRDSRSSRKRLLLFVASILLGVAALVAISAFGATLEVAINSQARDLLGADLAIRSNSTIEGEALELVRSLDGETSFQASFTSMAYFPKGEGLRLVQVRAIEGNFPYYGSLETDPPAAAGRYQQGPYALIDAALLEQFDVQIGDSVRLGEQTFEVLGRILSVPGEAVAFSVAAPRVFIPMAYLENTGLIQPGSRISYRAFLRFDSNRDVEALVEEKEEDFRAQQLRWETVERRKRSLGRAMENLYHFLNLVGFIALLLGALGVASAIHLYIKQKRSTVAVLRCLGCRSSQTVSIYLIQATCMGLIGAFAGALVGLGVQLIVPIVLADFLPVAIPFAIHWGAMLKGVTIGLGLSLLFAALPLLPIRRISPLVALRAEYDGVSPKLDLLQVLVCSLIGLFVLGFAISQTNRWYIGLFFFLGLATAFGVLAGAARLIMILVRGRFPKSWSYVWRQGLANLYRPQNQTLVMMLSIGLGTFLIVTLYLAQGTLLSQAELTGSGANPNLVFFDIQSDQKEAVREAISDSGAPILQDVPIVTMRLTSVQGRSVGELQEEDGPDRPSRWMLRREYRSTYRRELAESERVVSGKWIGQVEAAVESVPISLDEGIAEGLQLELGDQLVFDVQGVPVVTHLASTRTIDWQRVQPNFFAVFPAGVLEEAPQFHVMVTRVGSAAESGALQRKVIKQYPNISAVDLELILSSVEKILDKVSFVIRFMALFSLFTGLTVLAGAVITSRYQRLRETVLLRTLGASRRQVLQIMVIEYLLLGTLATLTGLLLAVAASWALAWYIFDSSFSAPLLPVAAALAMIVGLTIAIGFLNSRSLLDRPPLEILREDLAT